MLEIAWDVVWNIIPLWLGRLNLLAILVLTGLYIKKSPNSLGVLSAAN